MAAIDDTLFNNEITSWGKSTLSKLRNSINALSQKGKGELVRNIKMNTRKNYGLIYRLSYTFPRHGVFFHRGTGRGYKVVDGKVMRKPSGNKTISPGSIQRKKADWFNPVINSNIHFLVDKVAEHMADAALNAAKINIQ